MSIYDLAFVKRFEQRNEQTMMLNTAGEGVLIETSAPEFATYVPCRRATGEANPRVQEYHVQIMGILNPDYQDPSRGIRRATTE